MPRLNRAAPKHFLIRQELEDFRVEELPLFVADGSGEHLLLEIEKRGLSTAGLLRRLRLLYGASERDVGVAGRKDQAAVTTQWITVPARLMPDEGSKLQSDDVKVLSVDRHGRKLRLGFLRGNRFSMQVARADPSELLARARAAAARGVPNYFGAQRFGPGNTSLRDAEAWVSKFFRPRNSRERFLVSVFQSAIFNRWLTERVADDLARSALDGDVMGVVGSGSNFVSDDPIADTERVHAGTITSTGPLFGSRMRMPGGIALTRESRSLVRLGIDPGAPLSHPAFQIGDRRHALVFPSAVSVADSEGGARLTFELPPGSFATVFIDELANGHVTDVAFDAMSEHR